MNEQMTLTLNSNYTIPQFGFGCYQLPDYEVCKKAVKEALHLGIRHIDTAELYQNEKAVGDAIIESGIPREEIFLTTKVWINNFGFENTQKAVERSMKKLKVDYVDLVLLHHKFEDVKSAWSALEKMVSEGKIRSIGISNFDKKAIDKLLKAASITPAVNQVECHPYYQREDLRGYMNALGIRFESYYPLGHGSKELMSDPTLITLSKKYNKSVAQVILRWHIQKENIIFPKSTNPKHIADNHDIFDFEISTEDMEKIASMDRNKSFINVPDFIQHIFSLNSGRKIKVR